MAKVLVTGASGFLGGRLSQRLLDDGYSVRAFDLRSTDISHPSLEFVNGDITDLPSLAKAMDGCQIVFHVAAIVEAWLPDPSKFFSVNVEGTRNVLQAYKQTKTVEKIIYTSSYFAMGPTDGYVADETQKHPCKFICTEYEKSKAVADEIVLEAAADGIPVILVYPGVMYGEGKLTTGNIVARMMIERFNGRLPGYLGNGSDRNPFSHVDDVVSGQIAAMCKGRLGERYLLTGENASFNDVFDIAAHITKTSKSSFHIPIWFLKTYGLISILIARITGNLPLVSYPFVKALTHQWAYNCEKAKKELGYNPRSLNEGLKSMLFWLKDSGQIEF